MEKFIEVMLEVGIWWFAMIILFIIFNFSVFLKNYLNLVLMAKEKELNSNFNNSIETVNGLLNLIDNNIAVKVAHNFRESITLKKDYNVMNIDKDSHRIATEVYKEINPNIFINLNKTCKIYNEDFWMRYIVEKTTITILDTLVNVNYGRE